MSVSFGSLRWWTALVPVLLIALMTTSARADDLVSGGTVMGAIDFVGDQDTWTMPLQAGESYAVRIADVAITALYPRVTLFDPSGNEVSSGQSATVTGAGGVATTTGTYSIVVQDNSSGGSTGVYKIDYARVPSANEGGELTSGGKVSSVLDLGDIDSYTLTLTAGESFAVRLADKAFSSLYPRIVLFDPYGGEVTASQSSTVAALSGVAPFTGTYTVLLYDQSSGNDAQGAYDIYYTRFPGAVDGGALVSGGKVSGNLALGDLDTYTFNIAAGESFVVRLADVGFTSLYPRVTLYNPYGGEVALGQGSTVTGVSGVAGITGTYTVMISDQSSGNDAQGDYDIHFVRLPDADEGGALTSGGKLSGELTLGDLDTYTFDITAGESYVVRLADVGFTSLYPRVTLYSPFGSEVALGQDSTVTGVSGVAGFTGTYTILLSDQSSGADAQGEYDLHFARLPSANEGGALTSGAKVSGTLDLGDLDTFTFTLTAGESFIVRLADLGYTSLYPRVTVYDPYGGVLELDQDSTVAGLISSTPYTGTYTVLLSDQSSGADAQGAYDLHFVCIPGTTEHGVLLDGVTESDTIDLGDVDSYSFLGTAGETATVTVTDLGAGALYPYVLLYGPYGQFVEGDADSTIASFSELLPHDGFYTLVVVDNSSGADAIGDYSIVLSGSGSMPSLFPNAILPAQLPTDPVLADAGGDPAFGPRIGDVSQPFNFSLDCSSADTPSTYLMQVWSSALPSPITIGWGDFHLGGLTLLATSGVHSQSVEVWLPGGGIPIPNDAVLVGAGYTVQGWCGGYGQSGRLSNAITQTIGD